MLLPFAFYRYETLVVTLREGYRLGILRKGCRRKYLDVGRRNGGSKGRREHYKKRAKLGASWFVILDKCS